VQPPELLFVRDNCNCAALQCVPQDAWEDWVAILRQHKALICCQAVQVAHQQSKRESQARFQKAQNSLGEVKKSCAGVREAQTWN